MAFLLRTQLLLGPLAWHIMSGPRANQVMLLGAAFSLFELSRARVFSRLFSGMTIGVLTAIWVGLCLLIQDPAETFSPRSAIVTLFYGLPTGMCLAEYSRGRNQVWVAGGYSLFFLGLALVGVVIVRTVNLDELVRAIGNETYRTNPDDVVTFLRIFYIHNVIIGLISYTIFALVSLPLLLSPVRIWVKAIVLAGIAVGLYVNLKVVTRTAFLGMAVAWVVLIPLQLRAFRGRSETSQWLKLLSLLALLGLGFEFIRKGSEEFYYLLERFRDSASDGRLVTWIESIGLLQRWPFGHGVAALTSNTWGHNLFLDFGLTNGLAGMGVMLAMFAHIMRNGLRAVRQTGLVKEPMGCLLLGGFIATFTCSLLMPPQPHFMAFTYICAGYWLFRLRETRFEVADRSALAPSLPLSPSRNPRSS